MLRAVVLQPLAAARLPKPICHDSPARATRTALGVPGMGLTTGGSPPTRCTTIAVTTSTCYLPAR